MQSFAPGGKAAPLLLASQFRGEVELGDDLFEDGFALQNADLGLEVESGRLRGPFIGGGVHVAHVEEVFVEVLDLDGGARLVDGRLGEREQHPGEKAQAGHQDQGTFAAPEHVPVLEQQAGGLAVQYNGRRHFEVRRAAPADWPRRSCAVAGVWPGSFSSG